MSSFKQRPPEDYKPFLTNEQLFDFFCQNKFKISTIENPLTFLRLLRDNGLITDELYLKYSSGDSDLYPMLEYIEKRGKRNVKKFWDCVDQEDILQRYPQLSELTAALKSLLPEQDNKTGDRDTDEERKVKKRKTEERSLRPSSQNINKQRKTESADEESEEEKDLWDRPEHKQWLPVTCGNKEGRLDRKALRNYDQKKECISYRGSMIPPYIFEELGGKEKSNKWKTSIKCQDKTIQKLLEMGVLKMPE